MKLKPRDGIFGLPPRTYVSDHMVRNSMPWIQITPADPEIGEGLSIFTLKDNWQEFQKILSVVGFEIDPPIKFAFLADNFPTDTFSNEYTESFLQSLTNAASGALGQIAQITGKRYATEAAIELGKKTAEAGKEVGGVTGGIMGMVGEGARGAAEAVQSGLANLKRAGGFAGNVGAMAEKLLAGHRIDLPMVWRSSGYSPSYSVTIRLYNPNPKSVESTANHIIGPLAVLLCLASPRSDDGKTFSWPFFQKIKAFGLYDLNPSMITNITIIKGGDQQQIAFNQRPSIVDVRVDFGSLYSSIVLETSGSNIAHRPTVRTYLNSFAGYVTTEPRNSPPATAVNRLPQQTGQYQYQRDLSLNQTEGERSIAKREVVVEPETTNGRTTSRQEEIARILAEEIDPNLLVAI